MQEERNVRPDFAKLSADSDFYKPQDRRSTREKLKDMDTKGKVSFIAEYYGLKILTITFLAGFAIFFILHMIFAKDIGFSVLAVNTVQDVCPADEEEFYKEFLDKENFDWKKNEVSITVGLGVSKTGQDSASQTNLQSIQSRLMANSVDVFFADREVLYSVGEFEYLADLNDYLPADIMEKYKDDLVTVKGLDSGKTYPVGIRIPADNPWLVESGWYPDGAVVGIQTDAKHGELAADFLLEILGENK